MDVSISGFKVTGSWEDVVEHGEKMASILETIDEGDSYSVSTDLVEEFNEWRPKVRDLGEEDEISEKTAEKASISKNKSEEKDKSISEDIEDAASEVSKSVDSLSEKNLEDSWVYWKSTTSYMTRATDTFWRRNFRRVEKFVYKHLMTIVSPYYFDNPLVSANIQRKSKDTYSFEVNINDDELKSKIKSIMKDLDERDRWHLDHDHITEQNNPKDSEGVDSVEDTASMDSEEVKESIETSFQESE